MKEIDYSKLEEFVQEIQKKTLRKSIREVSSYKLNLKARILLANKKYRVEFKRINPKRVGYNEYVLIGEMETTIFETLKQASKFLNDLPEQWGKIDLDELIIQARS